MFKFFLQQLIEGQTLTQEQSYEAMTLILKGETTPSQISSYISLMTYRGVVVEELSGMATAMRDQALQVNIHLDAPVLDTCGTGGDGAKTLNVSTASALVCAASGLYIAKHGNRSVSSLSGSTDVLEELGLDINATPENIQQQLDDYHVCFMFAPFYHQALKHAAATRKEIGFRTVLNLLGPLTNPAGVKHQVIGVFDYRYSMLMAETLAALGSEHVLIVRGEDGLDEFSVSGLTHVTELKQRQIKQFTMNPEDVGLARFSLEDIQVQSPRESADLILAVLQGKMMGAARDIIVFNAGAALFVGGKAQDLADGVESAKQLIDSGQVYAHFQKMVDSKGEKHHA